LTGRVLGAVFLVASLALTPALAVTSVTYEHGMLTWERVERRAIPPRTVMEFSPDLAPGHSKLVFKGRSGLVEIAVRYTQREGGPVHRVVLAKALVRKPKPRVIAQGIEPGTLAAFEARGLTKMVAVAHAIVMTMVATAYTAGSAGGSGRTASGARAGYGIVAVDPRIIPLGTRLYIPGYGWAIAGDTGGDIVGNRIDLGFDSLRGALEFGRRDITIYRLR
jgi:3D (Asp-Asp-Asp) domain-containing protein